MEVAYLIGKEIEKNKSVTMTDWVESEVRVKKKTLLLIEDDELHAELIRRVFWDNGSAWKIHHVVSISDGLKWLEENTMPDLVIANYLLPDGTGLDLTKEAMSAEEVDFPLILITGIGSEQLAVHSLKSGAMDYVLKNSEELQELPWRAECAIRDWKNLIRRKRVEEELEIYARELERTTHDLEDFTHLMENYADKLDDVGRGYLGGVRKATERTAELTETLLMLSRVGRKFIELEKVNLNEQLDEICNDLSVPIEGRGGEVIVGKLPTISTQRVWMKELFINLIDNGLKFNLAEKPIVEVSCEEREKDYLFKVNDNGSGVKEKDLSRIFTPSERLFPQDYEGTSLRLTVCKKILDKFGGKIWMESRLGEGTTFYFSLPKNGVKNSFKRGIR
jgi:two-component system sensor histidine kinase/response regulator